MDRGGLCLCVCELGGGTTVWPRTPYPQPAYSTAPILPATIIQSPEEKIIPPPPPQDESDEEDNKGGGIWQRRRRRSQEEATEEERPPPTSVYPAGEVEFHGEDRSDKS